MKVMFEQKQIGDDIFFVRKVKKHWWCGYKTCPSDGRYDYISGVFYQRVKQNNDTPCKSNVKAPDKIMCVED